MVDQSSGHKPTVQVSLELFPDPLQRLRHLQDQLNKADEEHWLFLSEAAHREVELHSRRNLAKT